MGVSDLPVDAVSGGDAAVKRYLWLTFALWLVVWIEMAFTFVFGIVRGWPFVMGSAGFGLVIVWLWVRESWRDARRPRRARPF